MNASEPATGFSQQLAVVTRDIRVRVLNCSLSGCLLETTGRMEPGLVASLQMLIDGREHTDDVQVVRCQLVEGAGSLYHVAVRFLWTTHPERGAVRQGVWQLYRRAALSQGDAIQPIF